jgi:hypothetical protein
MLKLSKLSLYEITYTETITQDVSVAVKTAALIHVKKVKTFNTLLIMGEIIPQIGKRSYDTVE